MLINSIYKNKSISQDPSIIFKIEITEIFSECKILIYTNSYNISYFIDNSNLYNSFMNFFSSKNNENLNKQRKFNLLLFNSTNINKYIYNFIIDKYKKIIYI